MLSNIETNGTEVSVLFSAVSISKHARVVLGAGEYALFSEVSSVQGCPYRGFH